MVNRTLLSVLRNGPILPWDYDADIVWFLKNRNGKQLLRWSSSHRTQMENVRSALKTLRNSIAEIPEMDKYILCQTSDYVTQNKALNCHLVRIIFMTTCLCH